MVMTKDQLRKKGIIYGDEAEADQAAGSKFSQVPVGTVQATLPAPGGSITRTLNTNTGKANFQRYNPSSPTPLVQGALARLEQQNPAPSPAGLPPLQPRRPALPLTTQAQVAPKPPPPLMNDAVMDQIDKLPLPAKEKNKRKADRIATLWTMNKMTGQDTAAMPQTHEEFIQTNFVDQTPAILDELRTRPGGAAILREIEQSKRDLSDYMTSAGARVGITPYETSEAGLKEYYDNMIANNPNITPYNSAYAQELYIQMMPKNLKDIMERDTLWNQNFGQTGEDKKNYMWDGNNWVPKPEYQRQLMLDAQVKDRQAQADQENAMYSQSWAEKSAADNTKAGIPSIAVPSTSKPGQWEVQPQPVTFEDMVKEADATNQALEESGAPTRMRVVKTPKGPKTVEVPAARGNKTYQALGTKGREAVDLKIDALESASVDITTLSPEDQIIYGITGETPEERQTIAAKKAKTLRDRYYDTTTEEEKAAKRATGVVAVAQRVYHDPKSTPEAKAAAIDKLEERWNSMATTPEEKAAAKQAIAELRAGGKTSAPAKANQQAAKYPKDISEALKAGNIEEQYVPAILAARKMAEPGGAQPGQTMTQEALKIRGLTKGPTEDELKAMIPNPVVPFDIKNGYESDNHSASGLWYWDAKNNRAFKKINGKFVPYPTGEEWFAAFKKKNGRDPTKEEMYNADSVFYR